MKTLTIRNTGNSIVSIFGEERNTYYAANDMEKFRHVYNLITPKIHISFYNPDIVTFTALLASYVREPSVVIDKVMLGDTNITYLLYVFRMMEATGSARALDDYCKVWKDLDKKIKE